MKPRKIPLRTCVVTREKYEKKDLIRVVKDNQNIVSIDLTGKANGHGAYIKRDVSVLEQAKKTNALGRHLETQISEEIYKELENIINNK